MFEQVQGMQKPTIKVLRLTMLGWTLVSRIYQFPVFSIGQQCFVVADAAGYECALPYR